MSSGFVSIIGAGPGSPDHLTLKAFRHIQQADVVFYDALIHSSMRELFPPNARQIYVGKRSNNHSFAQEHIQAQMIHWAQKGKRVVRLKGGDPFIFGRGGEEVEALTEAGIQTEVVPGISSLNGIASSLALPLTHRELVRKVMIVEGYTLGQKATDWQQLTSFNGTVVIFMGASKAFEIAQNFINYGGKPETKMALVESAEDMTPYVQVKSLANIVSHGIAKVTQGPGIIYIGPTVELFLKWQASQKIKNNIVLTPFLTPNVQIKA